MIYLERDNTGKILGIYNSTLGDVPPNSIQITEAQKDSIFDNGYTHYIGSKGLKIIPPVVHTAQSLRKRLDRAIDAVEESMFLDKLGYVPSTEGIVRNKYLYDNAVAGKMGVNDDIVGKYKASMDAYRLLCINSFLAITILDMHITSNNLSQANDVIVKYIADNPT